MAGDLVCWEEGPPYPTKAVPSADRPQRACAGHQAPRSDRLLSKPLKVGTCDKGFWSQMRQRATFSFLAFSILALSSGMGSVASSRELGPLCVSPQVSEAEMSQGFSQPGVRARVSGRVWSTSAGPWLEVQSQSFLLFIVPTKPGASLIFWATAGTLSHHQAGCSRGSDITGLQGCSAGQLSVQAVLSCAGVTASRQTQQKSSSPSCGWGQRLGN